MNVSRDLFSWLLFISLCLIWGSSFMLMKSGMASLTSFQVASLRIASAGFIMAPWAFAALRRMPRRMLFPVFMSGLLGSLFPAYFFCVAQEKVESSLAGSLNSLTPIFVIIIGALFFKARTGVRQVIGVLVSFSGSVMLFTSQPGFGMDSHGFSVFLIALATLAYGLNVNVVNRFLIGISSVDIAAVALFLIAFPAAAVLLNTGFMDLDFSDPGILASCGYSVFLGVSGTALASILFYILIKRSGMVFASMVTYGIPVVANLWGLYFGEKVGPLQLFCLLLILSGVYLATRRAPLPADS